MSTTRAASRTAARTDAEALDHAYQAGVARFRASFDDGGWSDPEHRAHLAGLTAAAELATSQRP
ncbi:hypothetical protein [Leifsonia sp. Leaf264]|uniref:hypothetical protein n=1 Tax=Leifsonia sp. Leaf264 TaxID=1736314 RepID=UPI000AE447A8|nr:hypothetical protein [Leifsonia sp. Leaf264]